MKGQFYSSFNKLANCRDLITFGYEFFSEFEIGDISRQTPDNNFECFFFGTWKLEQFILSVIKMLLENSKHFRFSALKTFYNILRPVPPSKLHVATVCCCAYVWHGTRCCL